MRTGDEGRSLCSGSKRHRIHGTYSEPIPDSTPGTLAKGSSIVPPQNGNTHDYGDEQYGSRSLGPKNAPASYDNLNLTGRNTKATIRANSKSVPELTKHGLTFHS